METKDYLKDIQDIKNIMSQSVQFISLSGLSGILAGVYAIIGACLVNYLIKESHAELITSESDTFKLIVVTAVIVLLISIVTAYILTAKKAKKNDEKIWNSVTKRLLINFSIPLFTGGVFAFIVLQHGIYELIAPITLIFYGLACVNASKYTLRDVRFLGITEIIIGLLAAEFSSYGLLFWTVGFGICHILYGSIMYFKYDRK